MSHVATEVLYVGPERVECEGVGPQLCLQVRSSPDAEWHLFYDEIDGFDPTPGTSYQIEVRVIPVEDPPQDASTFRYELVRVIAQQR